MNPEKVNQPSVLIVDDNVNNLQVLGGFLQNEGLMVEFAVDGMSALKWLDKKKFDLILLDIMMSGMDGYEVCSTIKKNLPISEIPIIFITAKTDSESIIKGFEAGAVDYITKPFIKSELLIRVKTQLNIKKANEQIIHYLHQIEERNRKISDSIDYAKYIQNAVLSKSEENLKQLTEHFILDLPKDILSGDFYWVCKTEKRLIISVMDCTGHGVPAAFLSVLGISCLNEIVQGREITQANQILNELRKEIKQSLRQTGKKEESRDGIDIALCVIDTRKNEIQYSGANNPLYIISNIGGEPLLKEINPDQMPVGVHFLTDKSFTNHEIKLGIGDTFYIFSDGFIDQMGGDNNHRFKSERFKQLLLKIYDQPLYEQKEILEQTLNDWMGLNPQTDDILVIGARV